jgi:hypothetical protein
MKPSLLTVPLSGHRELPGFLFPEAVPHLAISKPLTIGVMGGLSRRRGISHVGLIMCGRNHRLGAAWSPSQGRAHRVV